MGMVQRRPFLISPLFIFIISLCALGISYFFYINWYLNAVDDIQLFVSKFQIQPGTLSTPGPWTFILITSLFGLIFIGSLSSIFIYYQKTYQLFRQQENFINNFTHELKTPIASIKLYLDTFSRHQLTDEERDNFISYMQKDADRLSTNVQQILLLAHLENRKGNYQFEETDLNDFLQTFINDSGHLFKNLTIDFVPNKSIPLISLNRELLDMLFMNIFTNAEKYNQGKATLEVSLRQVTTNIEIRFKDNGIGLKDSDLKSIFTKFYQVKKDEGFKGKSSGLGLYLCHLIMKLHKGRITAESRGLGNGSTFVLHLPINQFFLKSLRGINER